jgi:hypothetical protein
MKFLAAGNFFRSAQVLPLSMMMTGCFEDLFEYSTMGSTVKRTSLKVKTSFVVANSSSSSLILTEIFPFVLFF